MTDLQTDITHQGDRIEVLRQLPSDAVHGVLTNLSHISRETFSQAEKYQEWCESWARECKRVLKPGGHLLPFGTAQTHHRLACGIEDAEFEIRDTITWYHTKVDSDLSQFSEKYIPLAQCPVSEGTIAQNVLEHGTGALNIDACRVETEADVNLDGGKSSAEVILDRDQHPGWDRPWESDEEHVKQVAKETKKKVNKAEEEGRYPANLAFDARQADVLDEKVGELETGELKEGQAGNHTWSKNGGFESGNDHEHYSAKSGGPSRYFYVSGMDSKESLEFHKWLLRLITREGQTVLDPFHSPHTSARAARETNRRFIGIEASTDN